MFSRMTKSAAMSVPATLVLGAMLGANLLVGSLLIQPSVVLAINEQFIRDVDNQLRSTARLLDLAGYTLIDRHVEAIQVDSNRRNVITKRLQAGVPYAIVGVCDRDCMDMDLEVYDGNDRRVTFDVSDDDLPMVKITPMWTGEFKIVATMPSCNDFPCYYGVGVFRQ